MANHSAKRVRLTKERRSEQILDHAIDLVGERGYDNFSLKQLAERCGMTDAGLLHHFGSKEGLLVALLTERDKQDEDAITQAVAMSPSSEPRTRDQLLLVLHSIVARNAERPELARLYTTLRTEALRPGHPASDFFARRDAATMRLIAELLVPVSSDPVRAARAVVAMMNGLALQWLAEDRGFDLVAEWDHVAAGLIG